MNTFTQGQRVRITPEYAVAEYDDGSLASLVGQEGVVERWSGLYVYVPVTDPKTHETFTHLFLPEELEAV